VGELNKYECTIDNELQGVDPDVMTSVMMS